MRYYRLITTEACAVILQLFGREREHPVAAVLELQPGKRHLRIGLLQCRPAVADLYYQQPARRQESVGVRQDAAGQLQSVRPGAQRQFGFMAEFGRQVRQIASCPRRADCSGSGHSAVSPSAENRSDCMIFTLSDTPRASAFSRASSSAAGSISSRSTSTSGK